MRRFILTGTPGSGKTAILRQLERLGHGVVEEAATDVIALEQAKGNADPWTCPTFIDQVVSLQASRRARLNDPLQFHDRSAFCTAALADYLGYPPSDVLNRELERLKRDAFYDKRVFFVQSLGFVTPSAARRITLEEARRFEGVHEKNLPLARLRADPNLPGKRARSGGRDPRSCR